MGKYQKLIISLVGLVALAFGWSEVVQQEVVNSILVAGGAVMMLFDTLVNVFTEDNNE